jgi:hypothetical protein
LTLKALEDKAWLATPFSWPNQRGSYRPSTGGYISYGLPPPPRGRVEAADEMKGSDRIGFREVVITPDMVGKTVAVFTGIELKTENDRIAPGQVRWHNFLLEHGAISEVWKAKADGSIEVTHEKII